MSPSDRQFEMQIDIDAPRDAVWEALASDTELRRWFAPEARVRPGEGGEVVWDWGDLFHWPQTIEAWEPGRRLRTRYESAIDDGRGGKAPLFIEFQLEGDGGTTTLRLVQSGFGTGAAFDQEYDGISRGWPLELRSLRHYLEHHLGIERRLIWSRARLEGTPEEAWALLTGPEGLACGADIDGQREGDAYRIETADGDVFEGTVVRCDKHLFAGVAANHGDSFFRVSLDDCHGGVEAQLWLGTYGRPPEKATALQERWDALLGRLFAGKTAAAGEA